MNQDSSLQFKNIFACRYIGHEDQEVLGFCFFQQCQITDPFCLKCITKDCVNLHKKHQDEFCLGFKEIATLLNQEIQTQMEVVYDFQALRLQFIYCEKQISKNIFFNQAELLIKFSKLIEKVQYINFKLNEKMQIYERLLKSLQYQNYKDFKDEFPPIKKILYQQSKQNIFRRIAMLLDEKYKSSYQKIVCSNFTSLIEKLMKLYLERGQQIQSQGLLKDAISIFDKAIEKNPRLSEAYFYKGQALMQLKQFEEAIANFEEKIKLTPTNFPLSPQNQQIFQSNARARLDSFYSIIKCCDEIIKIDPNNSQIFFKKGQALVKLKQFDAAVSCFDETIRLNQNHSSAYIDKGFALFSLTQYSQAIECCDEGIRLHSENPTAYFNKANSLKNMKQYEEAILNYNEAIRLDPKNQFYYINKELLGQYEEGFKCYVEILSFDPQNQIVKYMHDKKGRDLIQLNQFDEAVKFFDWTIQLNPKNINGYFNKGKALVGLNQFDKAIQCYDEIIRLDPENSFAYLSKGNILTAIGKQEEGFKCYIEILKFDPQNCFVKNAHDKKGQELIQQNSFDQAIKFFDWTIQMNLKNSYGYYNKGIALFHQQKYSEAIKCYDEAVKLNPINPEVYQNQANALMRLNEYEKGIECIDDAIRLLPDSMHSYKEKGQALQSLSNYKEALVCFNLAIRNKQAQEFQEDLMGQVFQMI